MKYDPARKRLTPNLVVNDRSLRMCSLIYTNQGSQHVSHSLQILTTNDLRRQVGVRPQKMKFGSLYREFLTDSCGF